MFIKLARFAVKRWKSKLKAINVPERPWCDLAEGWDAINIRGSAPDGSAVLLTVRKVYGKQNLAEVSVYVKLSDGTAYKLPHHPDTAVGIFESIDNVWSAGGLKIYVLKEKERLRILYNGLLKRDTDEVIQHCRFSFIWTSATSVVGHPKDWSNELAAQALSLEPWWNDKWPYTLEKWGGGNWLQWGTIQGRFTSCTEGSIDQTEYLRLRGVRDRCWSPQGYRGLVRSVVITAIATDGTGVQLRGLSYKEVLTICFYGSVRLPNFKVQSLTDTDLILSDFCERSDGIPKVHTMNVSSKNRDFNVVLRINQDGGRLVSGVPYQHEVVYRTASVLINGVPGTAILELGYETSVKSSPPVDLSPHRLKWLSEKEAGDAGYCVPFEAHAAACTSFVGGKGASLALLASVQEQQGYTVPPGFCLTTKALEKHFQTNSGIRSAIDAIATANEDYDENNFRDKCNMAVDLFVNTDVVDEVKNEIIIHLNELRKKVIEQDFGRELRFAVRSSAVGEDSEALSAAGQNETILGCVTDDDVVKGVQKCWASMFAFTSAHYRRQNGQPCFCGGGVVIQTLAPARAAGVMFTRHPDVGDPTRLLITANYGLGETVVSGSVEPDTIVVTRGTDDELVISKITLGSKLTRVTASRDGVSNEQVPENERKIPCVSVSDILRLASIGVAQDKMWGAGRDIEWAVVKDEIFLLQARPITSLERWSEEELLHELDTPIMADDELTTFANTGEVLPKPLSAITYDLMCNPLSRGIYDIMYGMNGDYYDCPLAVTHNRLSLALYNCVYKLVSTEKPDLTLHMLEMAIHGHKVANDNIVDTARHRHIPTRWEIFMRTLYSIRDILRSKTAMNDQIKVVKKFNFDLETDHPMEILKTIASYGDTFLRCSSNHATTTSASATAQVLTMMVFVEGGSDFTPEQCNEVNVLLSSGGVLSAEVPQALANLTRELEKSGQAEEFRKQSPKVALNWLKNHIPNVYTLVTKFLDEHGHRAIMELDLATKPWTLVPEKMMEVLQNMPNSNQQNQVPSNADIVASVKTPNKASTRKILSLLLPLCRRTVRHRETTKGYFVLAVHKMRLALRHLGRLLVKKWYLPDEDLIFHFRLAELRDFILTRDPALLRKAIQRRQFYPSWCRLKFAELYKGWAQPLQTKELSVTPGDVRLEATTVCGGDVIARACVVTDLSEIGELQCGDVLITHSTDIGWSPYFPLLTGIVTELGGLISHGAVIAREYGLPCIVGAEGATEMFRTGDMVRLSGVKGFIEKVQLDKQVDT
ncbi:uncharacterized protein LOC113229980 [Hyposmocoma kahamanoa]|uniref:uncharacterized protein LOC113229980 n=1 Tax=Hyposmocoma kahamanoa TaxID=1477025 RepID=UPI000E6D976D|nr:uncharacterized protein LOC113229980 [Hyposmocoma kahamanoa]